MRLRFLLSLRSLALKRSLSEARLPTLVHARLSGCSPPREGAAASPGPGCRPPCWHGTPLQRLPRERPTSRPRPSSARATAASTLSLPRPYSRGRTPKSALHSPPALSDPQQARRGDPLLCLPPGGVSGLRPRSGPGGSLSVATRCGVTVTG